jgi:hypothetical protein
MIGIAVLIDAHQNTRLTEDLAQAYFEISGLFQETFRFISGSPGKIKAILNASKRTSAHIFMEESL